MSDVMLGNHVSGCRDVLSFARNENGMKRVPANTKHHSVTVYTEMLDTAAWLHSVYVRNQKLLLKHFK